MGLGENLGSFVENLELVKDFTVEINGGEAKGFNDDEVFMFRNKGKWKKNKLQEKKLEENERERRRDI